MKKHILMLAIVTTAASCNEKENVVLPPQKVQIVTAIQSDVPLYEDFVAQVYGEADVDIRARVEGWVTEINFKEGSRVKKGDLLYVIDDQEYRNRLSQSASELASAKTEMVRTKNELNRIKPLAEMEALSQMDLDNAQAAYEAAQAYVSACQANLQNAQLDLSYTRVQAPFDGIIGISNVRTGDYVSRGTNAVLSTISSVQSMRVRFQISEREYLRVAKLSPEELAQTKQEVQLVLADGSVYEEKGAVNFADREIDPKTGTLTIEALFANETGLLRPGMFVKARVLISTAKAAVLVPQRAVFQLQHLSQVYVLTDSSTLVATTIVPGAKSGDGWIIKEGLKPGDKVAIVGNASLTPNAKVEPIEQKWPAEAK
jgi:membrane fusion protein (multidrug efflux system)